MFLLTLLLLLSCEEEEKKIQESRTLFYEKPLSSFVFPGQESLAPLFHLDNLNRPDFMKAMNSLQQSISSKVYRKELDAKCDGLSWDPYLTLDHIPCIYFYIMKNLPVTEPIRTSSYKNKSITKKKDWDALKSMSYESIMDRLKIDNIREGIRYQKWLEEDKLNIPLSAALIRQWEDHLPLEESWKHIQRNYDQISKELDNKFTFSETIHARMGFLFLEHHQVKKAKDSFELSLRSSTTTERSRVLFWLGYITETPSYWDNLQREYPFSPHSIFSLSMQNKNITDMIQPDPDPMVSMLSEDKLSNLVSLLLSLLISQKKEKSIHEVCSQISHLVIPPDPSQALFQALIYRQAQCYGGAIRLIHNTRTKTVPMHPKVLEILYPIKYEELIEKYSSPLDPLLVTALMRQESSFNPWARSGAKAFGLMQVQEDTARRLGYTGKKSLWNVDENVRLGTNFLKRLFKTYPNDCAKALGSYNAGSNRIKEWSRRYPNSHHLLFADIMPYSETKNYPSSILRHALWYTYLENKGKDERDKLMTCLIPEDLKLFAREKKGD